MDERHTDEHPQQALEEIRRRQAQVIQAVDVPGWYWPIVGVSMLGLAAAVDTRRPVTVALASVLFALLVAGISLWVCLRAYRRAQWRKELLGSRGPAMIVGFVWLVVGLTLGSAFTLRAASVPHPATLATALGAVVLTVGGPRLMRNLHRIMLGNRVGVS